MNIWRTLLWKEFHEHKWKALTLTTIALSPLVAEMVGGTPDGMGLVGILYSYALLGPLHVAIGVSAAEQSNRSISFVNTLPVPTWKVGLVRILSGWLLLITPLVAIGLSSCLQISSGVFVTSREFSNNFGFAQEQSLYTIPLLMTLVVTGWCTNLYAWILAATVNQKSEMRAGLIGLVTTATLIWMGGIAIDRQVYSPGIVSLVVTGSGPITWLLWTIEGDHFSQQVAIWLACLQAGTVIALLTFSVRRYGRTPLLSSEALDQTTGINTGNGASLRPPMTSPAWALLWMQFRQSAPIAACALGVTLASAFTQRAASQIPEALGDLGAFFGCLLALIVGTGAFVHQLEPELHTFWRSRPIEPRQWFWMKYVAGALVIIGFYDIPLFLLQRSTALQPPLLDMILFPILLHLFAYSLAVIAACGIRHSVYSVILAGSATLTVILPSLAFAGIPRGLAFLTLWEYAARDYPGSSQWNYLWNAVYLLGPFIASSTLLAAWLVKRDISMSH